MPNQKHRPSDTKSLALTFARHAYHGLWQIARPLLGRHPRLRTGWQQRIFRQRPSFPIDLWIQAASAGEAYLAQVLVDHLQHASRPWRLWLTTNTAQGLEILDTIGHRLRNESSRLHIQTGYCPLDHPRTMRQVMACLRPRVVVLLEAELWPALMHEAHRHDAKLLIVNGRMSPGSRRHYCLWPQFWRPLAPHQVLAISRADARRFHEVFRPSRLEVVPNLKFDRISLPVANAPHDPDPWQQVLPAGHPFVVLGSIRRDEEDLVLKIMHRLVQLPQKPVIGLFPRHMERIGPWCRHLRTSGLTWALRSHLTEPASTGSIILWDRFGALAKAYNRAWTAFVGGSLKPLGGQNFLEPLTQGVIPVIGPHWKNFTWVGQSMFSGGLAHRGSDWRSVAAFLEKNLDAPPDRMTVQSALSQYVRHRQGGGKKAAGVIESLLDGCL